MYKCDIIVCICCHPPCGGCGLKYLYRKVIWIEYQSPSVWRVWIEIGVFSVLCNIAQKSPSVWRVWIEMCHGIYIFFISRVTLRVEGVD